MSSSESRSDDARPAFPRWLTPASLVALVLGCSLGILGDATGWTPLFRLAELLDPLASAWMAALRFTVVPLVVVQMMAVVLKAPLGKELRGLTLRAVGLFAFLLLAGALATAVVAPGLVSLYTPSPETVEAIRSGIDVGPPPSAPAEDEVAAPAARAISFVLELLTGRHILPLMLLAIGAGIVTLRLPGGVRAAVTRGVLAASDVLMKVIRVVILGAPLAVFWVLFDLSLAAGTGVASVAVVYMAMMCGLLIAAILALYPFTSLAGGMSMRTFARGVWPAQLVALGTRSSIASLPALMEEAERELRLPPAAAGVVLPLAVGVFKMHRPIADIFQLVFLGHLFGVPVGPAEIATFAATILLLSTTSAGIPSGGRAMRSLPAYLAAGIPIQGYLLANASEDVPDVFKTVINVTADMSVAVVASGGAARPATGGTTVPAAVEGVAAV